MILFCNENLTLKKWKQGVRCSHEGNEDLCLLKGMDSDLMKLILNTEAGGVRNRKKATLVVVEGTLFNDCVGN